MYPQVKAFIADFHAKAAQEHAVPTPARVANARAEAADHAAERVQLSIDPVEGPPEDSALAATPRKAPMRHASANGAARPATKRATTNGAAKAQRPAAKTAAAKAAAPSGRKAGAAATGAAE